MNLYYVLFLNLQIFVGGSSFSCPSSIPTISSVSSCPKNKQEWETAANRKKCEAIKQNCTESVNFQYHCLLNQQLNGTLEVCAPVYFLQGFCASYNIQKKQIVETYYDGYECLQFHGSEQCPSRYKSSEAYKYQRCYPYDVKTETSTNTPLPATTETYRYEECRCDDNSWIGVVIGLLIVVVTIVIHILIWRYREAIWKIFFEREGENNDEERNEEEQRLNPEVSRTVVPVNEDKRENLTNEIRSLKERLTEANKENAILKKRIEEQNEERSKEVEQLRESHRIKEEELQDSLTKNEKIAEERLKENQDLKETHTIKAKELQALIDSLSREKSVAEEGLKEANRMKVEELQERLKEANEENKNLKRRNDEQSEVPVNKDEIEKLKNEIHFLKDSLNKENNVAEERLKEADQLRQSLRIKEEELQSSVSKVEKERLKDIQDLKETHRIKEKELQDSLKKEKKVVEERAKENEQLSESHRLKEEELQKRLAEAIRDNGILKRQVEEQRGETVKTKPAPPRPKDPQRANEKEEKPVDEPIKSIKNKPAPPPPK